MIVTPKFVFIHMPKTGGTFVHQALNRIYGNKMYNQIREDYWGETVKRLAFWNKPVAYQIIKHAPCNDIPQEYRSLPIIGCIRNPLDWYISNYRYGWWRSHPADYPNLRTDPHWPDLSFEYYLQLSSGSWLKGLFPACTLPIGRLTALFILYYCHDPKYVIAAETIDELKNRVEAKLYPVRFLHTNNLNAELYDLLLAYDYSQNKIDFIKEKEAVSPRGNRKQSDSLENFYTPELRATVQAQDHLLFDLFPALSN